MLPDALPVAAGPVARIRLLPCLPVPDLPRGDGGHDGAAHRAPGGPEGDPHAHRAQDRPADPRLRDGVAPVQERHAHHGRRAHPGRHRHLHAAVVRPVQPLRLGGAGRHPGLRRHRLGGRLAQGRAQGSGGHALAREVFLAVRHRHRGRALPRVLHLRELQRARVRAVRHLDPVGLLDGPAAPGGPAGAVLQGSELPAGRARLRDPDLPSSSWVRATR